MIFQLTYYSSGSQVARANPSSDSKPGTHPGQDALSWQGSRAYTHSLAQSRTTQTFQFTSHIHFQDVGGNSIPKANPHRLGEKLQTPQRQWPQQGIIFFPPHERYNQTTLNKRTLFEYLLYFGQRGQLRKKVSPD